MGEYFCRIEDWDGNDYFVHWILKASDGSIQSKHETKELSQAQMARDEQMIITQLTYVAVVIGTMCLSSLVGYFVWCRPPKIQVVADHRTVIERVPVSDPPTTVTSSTSSDCDNGSLSIYF